MIRLRLSRSFNLLLSLLAVQAAMLVPSAAAEPVAEAPAPGVRCPMLYYHDVQGQVGLSVQLTGLLQAGYQPITFGRLVDALDGQVAPPPGRLVLTFDDGLA